VRAVPNAKPGKISPNRSSDENAPVISLEVQLRLAQIFGQQIQRGLARC
jgi:hypothetical protein